MTATVTQLLADLVAINSVNSRLPNGPGEAEIASYVADSARAIGADVHLHEVAPGRPNVVAWVRRGQRPAILLECHLDTVALDPMPDALNPRVANGRLYGRGAADPKACLAAMLKVLQAAASDRSFPVDVCLAGSVDEEIEMTGSGALARMGLEVDAAVVGEPTSFNVVVAQKGVLRWRVRTRGVAAHAATPEMGRNAIYDMGLVIAALRGAIEPTLNEIQHPRLGAGSWSLGTIAGGVAVNVVPERCEIECDRRTLPGQSTDDLLAVVDRALDEVRARHPHVRIERDSPFVDLPPIETDTDAAIVRAAQAAAAGAGGRVMGVPYGTDAAMLSEIGGIPCVVLGPGDIAQAHTNDEWVALDQVEAAVGVYSDLCHRFAAEVA